MKKLSLIMVGAFIILSSNAQQYNSGVPVQTAKYQYNTNSNDSYNFTIKKEAYRLGFSWSVVNEIAGDVYAVEVNYMNTNNWVEVYRTKAALNNIENDYTYTLTDNNRAGLYRLKIISTLGNERYSNPVKVDNMTRDVSVKSGPNGIVIQTNIVLRDVAVIDMGGRILATKTLNNYGYFDIPFTSSFTGVYFVKVIDNTGQQETFKLFR